MTAPEREMLEDFLRELGLTHTGVAQSVARALQDAGWCRREAVLREAARAVRQFVPTGNLDIVLKMNEHGLARDLYEACKGVQAQAEAAILSLLTPQARKEGEDAR